MDFGRCFELVVYIFYQLLGVIGAVPIFVLDYFNYVTIFGLLIYGGLIFFVIKSILVLPSSISSNVSRKSD